MTRPVGEHGIRVTIGRREDNDRFLAAFAGAAVEVSQRVEGVIR